MARARRGASGSSVKELFTKPWVGRMKGSQQGVGTHWRPRAILRPKRPGRAGSGPRRGRERQPHCDCGCDCRTPPPTTLQLSGRESSLCPPVTQKERSRQSRIPLSPASRPLIFCQHFWQERHRSQGAETRGETGGVPEAPSTVGKNPEGRGRGEQSTLSTLIFLILKHLLSRSNHTDSVPRK